MRIVNYKPNDMVIADQGFKFKEMKNLKQVVGLFGKNGSGKSRLLKSLERQVNEEFHTVGSIKSGINTLETRLKSQEDQIQTLKEMIEKFKGSPMLKNQKEQLKISEEARMGTINDIKKLNEKIEAVFSNIESPNDYSYVIRLESRESQIISHDDMMDSEYRNQTNSLIDNPTFNGIKINCIKFIKALVKSEISKKYQNQNKELTYFIHHDKLLARNIKILNLIRNNIKAILDKELTYSYDEHLIPILLLNNRRLFTGELSDGEKELLAFCVFLAIQSHDKILNETLALNGRIILLDEPDLFLHPRAQIDLINGLKNLVGEKGQIWVATHSITILSMLDRDEIWLMENGNIISPSIETPEKVLTSIIGEENIDSLENFVSSQYEWAAIQFALESLFPPSIAEHKVGDAQQNQAINRLTASDKPLKILDFGAGHGRIAQEILRNQTVAGNILYQALETNKEFSLELEKLTQKLQEISKIDKDKKREVLDTYEKLNEGKYSKYFDHVLLINVLHELDIHKWEKILNTIKASLKDKGSLIILEDQTIPRGENANEYGFVILNVQELQHLFTLKNEPNQFKHSDAKYAERLICVEVPKKEMKISLNSITQALMRKKNNCKVEIKALKEKKKKGPRDGRTNSFLAQLYANVDMALEAIK